MSAFGMAASGLPWSAMKRPVRADDDWVGWRVIVRETLKLDMTTPESVGLLKRAFSLPPCLAKLAPIYEPSYACTACFGV